MNRYCDSDSSGAACNDNDRFGGKFESNFEWIARGVDDFVTKKKNLEVQKCSQCKEQARKKFDCGWNFFM